MTTPNILNSSPPQPNVPFLTSTGDISRPWFYFLLSLYARTGGNTPPDPAQLQRQISALFVEEAFDDLSTPDSARSLSVLTGSAFADDVSSTPPASLPLLMAEALADGGQKPTLDPLIASLLVSGTDDVKPTTAPLSSNIAAGSAVGMTTFPAITDVTSILVPTGTWLVYGNVAYNAGATTVTSTAFAWTSTVSATLPTLPNAGAFNQILGSATGSYPTLVAGVQVLTLGAPTTVFLSTAAGFTTSTLAAYGFLGVVRL